MLPAAVAVSTSCVVSVPVSRYMGAASEPGLSYVPLVPKLPISPSVAARVIAPPLTSDEAEAA